MRWLLAVLIVAGCERAPAPPMAPAPMAASSSAMAMRQQAAPAQAETRAPMMAYSHRMEVQVQAAWVERHYTAALARCVAPACVVLTSQIDRNPGRLNPPSAAITARLTHDALPPYRDAAAAALPDEPAGGVAVRSQSTQAEDLGRVLEDTGRRLQQLNDYRTRLNALAARPDIQVADLIKVAETLSQTQSEIEAAEAEQRGLTQRVDTELMAIRFSGATPEAGTWGPVRSVWNRAGAVLSGATADMLVVVFSVLPWLPVLAVLGGLVWFAVRIVPRWRRGY